MQGTNFKNGKFVPDYDAVDSNGNKIWRKTPPSAPPATPESAIPAPATPGATPRQPLVPPTPPPMNDEDSDEP